MNKSWKSKTIFFLISQCVTLFGSTLVQMAIVWYVIKNTSSGLLVAAFTICSYLPQFLISFVAGAWADRFNRKFLILLSDSVIALVTLFMVLLMPVLTTEKILIIMLLVISVIRSIGSGVQTPAVNAMIPQLVPEECLMKYNGINATMQSIVQFAAPAAAGVMLTFSSLSNILLIDIITAMIGIGIFVFIAIPKQKKLEEQSLFKDMKEGIKYSFGNPFLSKLLITFGIFIFLSVPGGFLASLFVNRNFGDTYWYLTAEELVGFAGMLIGGLLLGTWGGFKKHSRTFTVGVLAFGVLSIAMGASPYFILYLAFMLLYGVALTMVQTATTTLIQKKAEESKQGRVFGLLGAMYSGALPIGMAVFGPLADVVSLRWIMVVTGVLLIVLSLIFNCFSRD